MGKNQLAPSGGASGPIVILSILLLAAVLLAVISQFKSIHLNLEDYPGLQVKELDLISRMQLNLFKSVEAEKMSVTTDTDESSKTFADQSQQKSDTVERDRQELGLLIKKDPTDRETNLLREFDHSWMEFRRIDGELLGFAVKNTNVKASQLSFGQGSEVLVRLEKALTEFRRVDSMNGKEQRAACLANDALVAGLKIHYLHAPHIAASDDKQMDKIEADIKKNKQIITNALNEMKSLVPEKKLTFLKEANLAFKDLIKLTAQVVDLSRQNTNVKSFELSLGRKRKVTAQCDEILKSLEEAIRSRSFKATR